MTISAIQYKKTSPYSSTQYLEGKFLDIWASRSLPAQADDIFAEISATYQYRPDLMAYDLYGSVDYWWVFTIRNKDIIKDPIFDHRAGTKIYIPKLNTILANLGG